MSCAFTRVSAFQVVKMADVALKWDHHVIPIPGLPELSRFIVLQQALVYEGVIQILNSQNWEFIGFVLTVTTRMPDGVACLTGPSI